MGEEEEAASARARVGGQRNGCRTGPSRESPGMGEEDVWKSLSGIEGQKSGIILGQR